MTESEIGLITSILQNSKTDDDSMNDRISELFYQLRDATNN